VTAGTCVTGGTTVTGGGTTGATTVPGGVRGGAPPGRAKACTCSGEMERRAAIERMDLNTLMTLFSYLEN
jgi:hypothetical protein